MPPSSVLSGLRVIKVIADVDESVANANEVRLDLETRILPEMKFKYAGLRYAMEGEGKEQKESSGRCGKRIFSGPFLYLCSPRHPLQILQPTPCGHGCHPLWRCGGHCGASHHGI